MSKAKPDNRSDKVSPDLDTPTDLPQAAAEKISAALNTLLADAFALYLKTKNFHWHASGRRQIGRGIEIGGSLGGPVVGLGFAHDGPSC